MAARRWRGSSRERGRSSLDPARAVITRYVHDPLTGELTNVNYNDDTETFPTPDVGYTYTRLGQVESVTDGTGTRDFIHDPARPWRLASEALDTFHGSRVLTRLHQTSGVLGRARGFKLGATADSASDLEQAYSFSADGRFNTLVSQRNGSSGTDRTFDYGYFTNSSLLGTLDSGSFHVAWDYEGHRDLLKTIDSSWTGQGSPISRYDYTHNNLRQRATARQSGSAFADYGEPTFRKFTYNPRGELTQAVDYLGSSVTDLSKPLPGRWHGCDYDNAGNRKWSNHTGVPELAEFYESNALNQYTEKENTTVPLSGSTVAGATVAVGGQTSASGQQGRFWSNEVVVANESSPWSGTLPVHAAYNGAVRTETRAAKIPAFAQSLDYDPDGNLESDGIWDYLWDAENRLIRMETTAAARNAGIAWRVLKFRYDFAGRRVEKLVFNGATFSLLSGRRYLYDGWNLVAEYATGGVTLGALKRSYTWGLDVVGSLRASGGVGALLQIADHDTGKTYLATYDGNGNLAALVNGSTGALAATYEYNSFGEPLRAEVFDSTVADQPFRFSTKFTDLETGLVYYGHRYYSPSLGRFINRDPIGEPGGLNLYGFCGNDGVNGFDVLGLQSTDTVPFRGDDFSGSIFLDLDKLFGDNSNWLEPTILLPAIYNKNAPGNENVAQNGDPRGRPSGPASPDNNPEATRGGPAVNSELPTLYIPSSRTPVQDAFMERGMIPPDAAMIADMLHISLEHAQAIESAIGLAFGGAIAAITIYYPPSGVALAVGIIWDPNDRNSNFEKGLAAGGLVLGGTVAIVRIIPRMVNTAAITGTANAAEVMAELKVSSVMAPGGRGMFAIGSLDDIARVRGQPGVTILDISDDVYRSMSPSQFDRLNAQVINAAVQRGDVIVIVTDPAAHALRLGANAGKSRLLTLELPMLQQMDAIPVPVPALVVP